MFPPLKLKSLLAENANANQDDVLAIKTLLRKLGLYETPEWGMTNFPDHEMFKAIRAFQDKAGLKVDGRMKPDGETQTALHQAAQKLQGLGRNGDTVLAHISPAEARMLKAKGGAGTVNPKTGLLEFYAAGKKQGSYIWRTRGDGKVRPSHAERDGQTFSWDNPPEGGHPGEAPNCRCTAEETDKKDVNCQELQKEINLAKNEVDSIKREVEGHRKNLHRSEEKFVQRENELFMQIANIDLPDLDVDDDNFLQRLKSILKRLSLIHYFDQIAEAWYRRDKAKRAMGIARQELENAEKKLEEAEEQLLNLWKKYDEKCG